MSSITPIDALRSALALAEAGLAVFPCNSRKMPSWPRCAGGKGFHDASCDQDVIIRTWKAWPGALVGVRTGAASDLCVLDLDLQHDPAADWLHQHRDSVLGFRANETRSGGLHVLFRHDPAIRNSAGRIHKNVDVRGEGGYIIWWPSNGFSVLNQEQEIVQMPAWLASVARPKVVERPLAPTRVDISAVSDRYICAAVERAFERVAMAPEGQRNDTLNREAYGLARFVSVGALRSSDVMEAMMRAATMAGLSEIEADRTINSAMRGRAANG